MKNILISIGLAFTSFYALSSAGVVSKVVPKNLHVYNFAGNTYVDLK